MRRAFSDEDRAFIERAAMFFIATADAEGRPDCSYKGGVPGFVRVLDERTVADPEAQHEPVGVELSERYCEVAAARLAQQVLPVSAGVA